MSNLTDLTLSEMRTGLSTRKFSSRELVHAALDQIAKLDSSLHAFLHLDAESALKQADDADKNHQPDKPLQGIPIAIKDVLMIESLPCTCGSRILEGFIAPYTATSVKRLKEAGAIIIGKTNMDEFAMGSSTENSAYGVTRNPWDVTRVPGGSSGGSAAAVAAHYVPVALGTDTGGSIRQPASLCGVTGLKTTYGRISRYGLVAFGSSLDTVGAFGRTAEDVATIFSIMAGHDNKDATSVNQPVPQIKFDDDAVRGLKIGVPKEYFITGIQPEVEEKTRAAIEMLKNLGAEIREISLPHTEYALPVYYIIAPAEASANLARYDGIRYGPRVDADNLLDVYFKTRGGKFGAEVARRIMIGTYALSAGYYDAYYGQAQKVRTLIKRDFENAFKDVDVIAAPTAPTTAFKIGEHVNDPLAMYLEDVFTLPASLAGVPGISFNIGFDKNNLPVGLQLIGPHFREDLLLRVTHAYQQVTDCHKKQPSL
ncbi:MAG: Asp-tRNA(Asn)/Glu-tRNA(Gln) amidotransferase subunit GatA [Anaerolineales bacterium]